MDITFWVILVVGIFGIGGSIAGWYYDQKARRESYRDVFRRSSSSPDGSGGVDR